MFWCQSSNAHRCNVPPFSDFCLKYVDGENAGKDDDVDENDGEDEDEVGDVEGNVGGGCPKPMVSGQLGGMSPGHSLLVTPPDTSALGRFIFFPI